MEGDTIRTKQRHRCAAQWRELVVAWERSGMSRRSWCAEQGVSAESLRRWAKRLWRSTEDAALVELAKERAPSTSEATIRVKITRSGELELSGPNSEEIIRCLIRAMRDSSDVH